MPAYVPPALRNRAPDPLDINSGDSVIGSSVEVNSTNQSAKYTSTSDQLPPQSAARFFNHSQDRTNRFPQRRQDNGDFLTVTEIHHYYWPNLATLSSDHAKPKYSTLNSSEEDPGKLTYVVLFKGANPRWKEGIIFVKTALELLRCKSESNDAESSGREDPIELSPPTTTVNFPTYPIATFTQTGGLRGQSARNFRFTGYRTINAVDFLEPNSPRLVEMLEQKWHQPKIAPKPTATATDTDTANPSPSLGSSTVENVATTTENSRLAGWGKSTPKGKVRDPGRWKESLNVEWAVVKFVECPESEDLKPPEIEKIDLDSGEADRGGSGEKSEEAETGQKKSVNEMLREMRLKGHG